MYLAVDFRNITTITEQGLGYRAQQQNIWIDFTACAERYRQQAEHDTQSRARMIGWRDAFASPAYIALCSDPPLRICFPRIAGFWRRDRAFIRLQQQLTAAGWRTLDLA